MFFSLANRTIQCNTTLYNSFQLHLYLYNNKMSAIGIKCPQFSCTVNDNGVKSNDQHYHIQNKEQPYHIPLIMKLNRIIVIPREAVSYGYLFVIQLY